MKRYIFFLIIALSICISGCTDKNEVSDKPSITNNNSTIIKISDQQQIYSALVSGPVFLAIGYESCPACKAMTPTIEEIASEYAGRATVMYIDTRENSQLTDEFNVYYVPDMCVIMNHDSLGYNFTTFQGIITRDRSIARFIGVTDKLDLENTLDKAIALRYKT